MVNGSRYGEYLLLERLNAGRAAEVFTAKKLGVEAFDRVLVIKRLLPSVCEDNEFVTMWIDEARKAVLLRHANIVQLFELGKSENQYYIAMEYVAGMDLRRIVAWFRAHKKMMPVPLAAFICAKICEGLDYAHKKLNVHGSASNFVHGGLSPQNVFVSFDGQVKVSDFGIAKAAHHLAATHAGILKGKIAYMSPEQGGGHAFDRRSDVFSCGALLHEMLTGHCLFEAESQVATFKKVMECEIPRMGERNAGIPAG